MRLLFVCILSLFFTSVSYAQSNYRRGYIITHDNDSVHGWIDFRTTKMNAAACNFRETENSKIKIFYPGDIFGYRFLEEGKFYISRNISIDDIERTVFLEYLIKGMMDLYAYENEENTTYYLFENENGEMIPIKKLGNKIVYSESIGRHKVKEDRQYRGMLRYIFQDSKEVAEKTDKIRLDERNIINLTKEYHEQVCATGEKCIVFETKEDKKYIKIEYSLYGGIHKINNLKIYHEQVDLVELKDINCITFGGLVNFSIPRHMKSTSIILDFSATNFKKTILKKIMGKKSIMITISKLGYSILGQGCAILFIIKG